MSLFMIETDAVTSAATSLESVANQVSNLSSNVAGYDTSCEDGFNFAGAKGVIAANIDACRVKIANTVALMNNVVNSHTQLQNSLKFQDPTGGNKSADDGKKTTGGNKYPGGGGYTGGSGGSSGGGSSSSSEKKKEEEEKEKIVDVTQQLNKVGYAYPDEEHLTDESKKVFQNVLFKYNEGGYGMVGERYVISCDPSVGKVGDLIRFTKENGETVECIVGVNTVSDKYKNSINFMINKEAASTFQVSPVSEGLLQGLQKAENYGNYDTYMKNNPITEINPIKEVSI